MGSSEQPPNPARERLVREAHDAQRPGERFHCEQCADSLTLHALGERYETPDQVIELARSQGWDTDRYEVDHVTVNTYEIGMKVEEQVGKSKVTTGAIVVPMFSVRVSMRLKSGLASLDAERFLEAVAKRAPRRKGRKRADRGEAGLLLEVSIPDLHLMQRGYAAACGLEAYDAEVAERLFLGAVEELLALAEPYAVERILFPLGNDFLHVDREPGTTTKGTQVGGVADWTAGFTCGQRLLLQAVERLRERAPVDLVSVPGNHDQATTVAYAQVLAAYYRQDPDVTVTRSTERRHLYEWGRCLIGFEHGRSIKPVRLAGLMAAMDPQAWARTRYRAWHLGDQHRRGHARPVVFEELGVGIEYLPSLAPTSLYEYQQGWTHHVRAATAYVWGRERGQIARLSVDVPAIDGVDDAD